MVQLVRAKALFDCVGDEESELTFREGDLLVDVRETSEDGWLHGRLERTGEEGLFPDNYVELIYVDVEPSKRTLPPQLPARPSSTVKVTSSPLKLDISAKQLADVAAMKPQLPARNGQKSIASGLNNLSTVSGLGPKALSGIHKSATMTPFVEGISDSSRSSSGPPALPKRNNTLNDIGNGGNSEDSSPAPSLSVRERMANLSMASQRQMSAASTPAVGARPTPVLPKPLSTAPRPTLPPRAQNESAGTSSSTSANPSSPQKEYQVQDAAVPVPKLTTFARPRSARTTKGPGSAAKSPTTPSTPSTVIRAEVASTPPKLPSRTPTLPPSSNTTSGENPVDSSNNNSGPVRFSPAAIRQTQSDLNTLPTITRNPQPLALPSRANLGSSPHTVPAGRSPQGLPKAASSEAAKDITSAEKNDHPSPDDSRGPPGSAFGVKLNSVGHKVSKDTAAPFTSESSKDKAPPLPARSSTIPVTFPTQPEGFSTPSTRPLSQWESNARSFSPSSTAANAASAVRSWSTQSSPGKVVTGTPAQETIKVKPDARRRYEALYKSVTSRDYIEGTKVHAIYVRSRLDSKTLAQIWDLVDIDNAGRLTQAQFCMGLYLIDERLASGLIPLEVSDDLWVSVMH
ncbi:MAG: hypothetical protein J3Q66DRAFT_1820 [Benniella sp.]|nr:MAG: hypothetical protein J3Q66DRAFT_1820 [Benniella sp.]